VKKIAVLTAAFALLAGSVSASSMHGDYKGNPIVKVTSNGKQLEPANVPAMIIDGYTAVPISLLRQLGATVTWDAATYTADIKLPESSKSPDPASEANALPNVKKLQIELSPAVSLVQFQTESSLGITLLNFRLTSSRDKNSDAFNGIIAKAASYKVDQLRLEEPGIFEKIYYIDIKKARDFSDKKITQSEFNSSIRIVSKTDDLGIQPYSDANPTIHTKIDGTFEGYLKMKKYMMLNGQVWQQKDDDTTMLIDPVKDPKVTIYKDGETYKMKVAGMEHAVKVILDCAACVPSWR